MKVLYLVSGISPSAGWGSEYIQNLIIESTRQGVKATIISPIYSNTASGWQQWVKELEKKYQIKIIIPTVPDWVKTSRLFHFLITPFITTAAATRLLSKEKFDLVHDFSSIPIILPRELIFRFFKTPVIFSWSVYNRLFIGRSIWFKIFNFASIYIVYDLKLKNKLLKLGLKPEKVHFMLPNINDSFFGKKLTMQQARQRLHLKEDKFIYSYFGSVTKEKGVFDFIEAIKKLDKDFKEMVLFIFAISSKKDISILEKHLSGENCIKIIPGLIDIQILINASNIVVLPQQTGHGTTIPAISLLEAVSLNKPIIATKTIGNQGLEEKINGIFIDPKNPLSLKDAIKKSYNLQVLKTSTLKVPNATESVRELLQIYQSVLTKKSH